VATQRCGVTGFASAGGAAAVTTPLLASWSNATCCSAFASFRDSPS